MNLQEDNAIGFIKKYNEKFIFGSNLENFKSKSEQDGYLVDLSSNINNLLDQVTKLELTLAEAKEIEEVISRIRVLIDQTSKVNDRLEIITVSINIKIFSRLGMGWQHQNLNTFVNGINSLFSIKLTRIMKGKPIGKLHKDTKNLLLTSLYSLDEDIHQKVLFAIKSELMPNTYTSFQASLADYLTKLE